MSCQRAAVTLGNERVMKLRCNGCAKGASIEKSRDCMRGALEALIDDPNTDVLILSESYEHEYGGAGLQALKEIAGTLKESRCWSLARLTPDDCKRCEASRSFQLKKAIEETSSDPASGLRKLQDISRDMLARNEHGAKKCQSCRSDFVKSNLEPIVNALAGSALLRGGRGRDSYAAMLQPLVRPCFLSSRLKLEPPQGCELIDSYQVDETDLKVYRLSDQLQNLYFLSPPEYKLSHEEVLLLQTARQLIIESMPDLDPHPLRAREQIGRLGEDIMARHAIDQRLQISKQDVRRLASYLARFTAGLGLLESLLADPKVQDVYVDAPVGRTPVHIIHRDHDECITNIFLTPDDAESLISRFRAVSGRPFSEADPVLDLNLGEVRVAAIGKPLSSDGLAFALRRHKPTPWTLPQFVRANFLSPRAAGLLGLLVDSQVSLLIAGSRGSGKTSLLGALMLELLPKSRIITIEDTLEIPVGQMRELGYKIQSLQVQSAVSGTGAELGAEDALRAALRLGESVLVVGEVRGEEARTLYEAMRVGAAGNSVMGTIHGATARDVFDRVVNDLKIAPSSFKATEAIVVAAPIRRRGGISRARRLVQITEVRRGWRSDPVAEGGFENLMYYDYGTDGLRPTRALRSGKSELMAAISRKWGVSPREVLNNLEFRSKVQEELVAQSTQLNRPGLLEAVFVSRSNLSWHSLLEEQLRHGKADYRRLLRDWRAWLSASAGGRDA